MRNRQSHCGRALAVILRKASRLNPLNVLFSKQRIQYLRVISLLVRRDLKVKYRGSFFGYLWSMINPLLFMLIITLVFGNFSRDIEHFNIFVLAGILCWQMMSGSIIAGTASIVNGAHLLRKVKLPIWVLPAVPLGTFLTNLALAIFPFALVFLSIGLKPHWELVFFPLLLVLLAFFVFGIALSLASLNVLFRDVGHVLEPVLSLAFYGTPIVYDRHSGVFSGSISKLLALNPFTHFVEAFRACLIGYKSDQLPQKLLLLSLMASMSMLIGLLIYKKIKPRIMFNV
jgi:ABC-type polysaccharide/polyol phosphate export permease